MKLPNSVFHGGSDCHDLQCDLLRVNDLLKKCKELDEEKKNEQVGNLDDHPFE